MQREPGKRDYGSSDCAQLRSLASRGVFVPQPSKPPRQEHADHSRSGARRGQRSARAPA
ncbi:hypothetical protein [Luteibacter sp. SG786]|uniref:hypothetical protein n=1 Tax=Luteibacter sp. SG786 TaxID=2587130 RepID=UPI001423B14B|nr:hypothetical protein [Luteibacter sp. SG786]NII55757.1 hypothetical protein [Luteibacter sp. SG786]